MTELPSGISSLNNNPLVDIIRDETERQSFLATAKAQVDQALSKAFVLAGKNKRKIQVKLDNAISSQVEALSLAKWNRLDPEQQTAPQAIILKERALVEAIAANLKVVEHNAAGAPDGVETKIATRVFTNKAFDEINEVLHDFTGQGRSR